MHMLSHITIINSIIIYPYNSSVTILDNSFLDSKLNPINPCSLHLLTLYNEFLTEKIKNLHIPNPPINRAIQPIIISTIHLYANGYLLQFFSVFIA